MRNRDELVLGDVALMRGFKRVHVGKTVEMAVTFPAQKNRDTYSVFIYLGEVTRDELPTFVPDDRLGMIGWMPKPETPAATPSRESTTE